MGRGGHLEDDGGFTMGLSGGGVGLGCAGAPPGCVHGPVPVRVTQEGCKVQWFLAQAQAGTADRAGAAQSCGGREGGGISAPINQGTGGGVMAPGLWGGDTHTTLEPLEPHWGTGARQCTPTSHAPPWVSGALSISGRRGGDGDSTRLPPHRYIRCCCC